MNRLRLIRSVSLVTDGWCGLPRGRTLLARTCVVQGTSVRSLPLSITDLRSWGYQNRRALGIWVTRLHLWYP